LSGVWKTHRYPSPHHGASHGLTPCRWADPPKFDLDLYIQNYKGEQMPSHADQLIFSNRTIGRTRFDRLFLIGRSSVPLCVDALKAAIAEAKRGKDTQRYREAVECLRIAAPSEPEAAFDQAWLEAQEAANQIETNRLLTELKGYKNNLIKESIRVSQSARREMSSY
jgi:COP9 signalosome complex subunit 1